MAKTNVWMSVSDLMTGLMIIFLFVAIAYISRVQKNQSVLTDYVETKNELHNKLIKEFEGDTLKWQMTIGKDLTMKFKEPTVLFSTGGAKGIGRHPGKLLLALFAVHLVNFHGVTAERAVLWK